MNAGLLVIILLLGLAFLGFPIYIALGIGTLAALNMAGMPALVLPQKLFAGMNSSSLLAIPFFILAGNIMSRSITVKLIDIANAIIGSGLRAVRRHFRLRRGYGLRHRRHHHSRHAARGLSQRVFHRDCIHFLNPRPHHPPLHHPDRVCLHHQRIGVSAVHGFCDPRYSAGRQPDRLCAGLRQEKEPACPRKADA